MSADLVVVVPDHHIEQSLYGLLANPAKPGIRLITGVKCKVHRDRDPGVYHTGNELISGDARNHEHALLVLDFAWEGRPTENPAEMAADIEARCRRDWGDRVKCIVVIPEIEVWVWSDSPHVGPTLGWASTPELRSWLRDRNLWPNGVLKPPDPKAAFESALREKRLPPSSAIFRKLADKVGFQRCADASFKELTAVLRGWFPKT